MTQLVAIAGAPGTGKTTVSRLLHARLSCPYIELGHLRAGHLLQPDWSDENERETAMAFENLAFIVRNYPRHGYQPVLTLDLLESLVFQAPRVFSDLEYVIVTLIVTDDAVLRERVLDPLRDSGFRNVRAALEWNQRDREGPLLQRQYRIDNTAANPERAVERILEIIA